ncbi:DUF6114 domain-containing protein [Microbacterium sp. NPDC058389]|uniref:DUF6114 domain-containing protein n=1 Tax=Microbacterium sp. NPDC058389 TaxID=3346475 RepID=UPI00364FFCB8
MHATDPHDEQTVDLDELLETRASRATAAPTNGGASAWYRSRPVIGGSIAVLGALAMLLSTQLDLGNITVHVGIEGMQATILPLVIALAGILSVAMPAHRIFYGVIVLIGSIYSLVAVNLGGFFVGFLLGCIGGIMVVSWAPRAAAASTATETVDAAAPTTSTFAVDAPVAEGAHTAHEVPGASGVAEGRA